MKYITKFVAKRLPLLTSTLLLMPTIVYAQGTGGQGAPGPQRLLNPLSVNSIQELLQLILDIVTIFAVPLIIFFIIYAGFIFVTAQGNEAKLTKAKNAILYAVIGGVIILGANVLLTVITNTVNSLRAPNMIQSLFLIVILFAPAFAYGAAPTDFRGLVGVFLGIINLIIPLLFGLALLVFLWGVANAWIFSAGDETKIKKGKQIALAGIIGLVVMSGVWGIVALVADSFYY